MSAANRSHRRLTRAIVQRQPLALLLLLAGLPSLAQASGLVEGRGQNLADSALATLDARAKPRTAIDGAALADRALGDIRPAAEVTLPDRDADARKTAQWSQLADQALDQLRPLPPTRPAAAQNVRVQINKVLLPPPVTHLQPSFAIAEPPAAVSVAVTPAPVAAAPVTPGIQPASQAKPIATANVVSAPATSRPTGTAALPVATTPIVAVPPAVSTTEAAPAARAAAEENYTRPAAPAPSVIAAPLPELPHEAAATAQPRAAAELAVAPLTESTAIAVPQQAAAAEEVKPMAQPVAAIATVAVSKPAAITLPPPTIAPLKLLSVALLNGPRPLPSAPTPVPAAAPVAAKPSAADKPVASFAVIKTGGAKPDAAHKLNNRKLADEALATVEPTVQHTQPQAPLNFTGLNGNAAVAHKPEPATGDLGTIDPRPHTDSPAAEIASAVQPADLKQELWHEWNEKLGLLEQENNALRAKLGQAEQDPLQDIRVDVVANIREKVLRERIAELEKELLATQNKAKDTTLQNAVKDATSRALGKPPVPPPPGAKDLVGKEPAAKDSATKTAPQ